MYSHYLGFFAMYPMYSLLPNIRPPPPPTLPLIRFWCDFSRSPDYSPPPPQKKKKKSNVTPTRFTDLSFKVVCATRTETLVTLCKLIVR